MLRSVFRMSRREQLRAQLGARHTRRLLDADNAPSGNARALPIADRAFVNAQHFRQARYGTRRVNRPLQGMKGIAHAP